jgi:hypothetical protein
VPDWVVTAEDEVPLFVKPPPTKLKTPDAVLLFPPTIF